MRTFNPFTMQETENDLFSQKNNLVVTNRETKRVKHELSNPMEVLKYKLSREKKRMETRLEYSIY